MKAEASVICKWDKDQQLWSCTCANWRNSRSTTKCKHVRLTKATGHGCVHQRALGRTDAAGANPVVNEPSDDDINSSSDEPNGNAPGEQTGGAAHLDAASDNDFHFEDEFKDIDDDDDGVDDLETDFGIDDLQSDIDSNDSSDSGSDEDWRSGGSTSHISVSSNHSSESSEERPAEIPPRHPSATRQARELEIKTGKAMVSAVRHPQRRIKDITRFLYPSDEQTDARRSTRAAMERHIDFIVTHLDALRKCAVVALFSAGGQRKCTQALVYVNGTP